MIAMDLFFFMAASSTPVLRLKCLQHTGVVAAHAMRRREATPELVRLIGKDIDDMGHTKVVDKCNNKPAMNASTSRVRDARAHPTIVE